MKQKIKGICVICVLLAVIIAIGAGYLYMKNWPRRFRSEFDKFFGEGNWHVISEETKESILIDKHVSVHESPELSYDVPVKYRNWYIQVQDGTGKEEIWRITNHTLLISRDKYSIFSGKRLSAKQALVQELMEISFSIAEEDVRKEVIAPLLTEEQAACMDVVVMYKGGNPKPDFYDDLWEESWFTASGISAEHYLTSNLYDFYLYIRAFDYRVEKLDRKAQQELMDSLDMICEAMMGRFGRDAAFEIYLDSEHRREHFTE